MSRKYLSVIMAVCGACILIIIGEWFYALWVQKHILHSVDIQQIELPLDEMPVIELLRQPEESYVDLVTRPLFIKGRKPVNEPLSETSQASKAVTNTFDWQLNGIYTTPKGITALLSRSKTKTTKDAHRKITIGAELDGWKLTEIQKDRILLELNNQSKELLLQKSKPKELSKKLNTPLLGGLPPEIPNIPPAPEVPNPFNTPNSPQPVENIGNDNP